MGLITFMYKNQEVKPQNGDIYTRSVEAGVHSRAIWRQSSDGEWVKIGGMEGSTDGCSNSFFTTYFSLFRNGDVRKETLQKLNFPINPAEAYKFTADSFYG